LPKFGATAATFPSAKQLSSWVGACPGEEESAGVNYSHDLEGQPQHAAHSHQAANAAVKAKGTIFEIVYRRMHHASDINKLSEWLRIGSVSSSGSSSTRRVRYEERGPAVTKHPSNAALPDDQATRSLGYE